MKNSLVELAKKKSGVTAIVSSHKGNLSDRDAVELLMAYINHEITTHGIREALNASGYKIKSGHGLSNLISRFITLARHREIDITVNFRT